MIETLVHSEKPSLELEFFTHQIRMLRTHPYFSGQCPECHARMALQDSLPKQCWCVNCGWNDFPSQSKYLSLSPVLIEIER